MGLPRCLACGLLLACLGLWSCDRAPASPTAATPPRRIASLTPAATELLFAVGCGAAVVLRDRASDMPAAATAVAAVDGLQPNTEAVLAVAPDLVVTNYLPPQLQAGLQRAAVPWLLLDPADARSVAVAIETTGHRCGQPAQAAAVAARYLAALAAVQRATAGRPAPRVYFEADATDPLHPFTVGRASFGHDLLGIAGGRNVFGDRAEGWFAVSAEAVLATDPDVIVLADGDVPDRPQSAATVAARPGWARLRAVQEHHIVVVPAGLVSRPGPRLALGAAALARALHPGITLHDAGALP